MEVWQYPPRNGVIESLQWVTDVIRCKTAEWRFSLQEVPRQTLLLKHQLSEQEYGLACQKRRLVGGDPLFVPYWPAMTQIPTISAGTVSLPVDATHVPAYKVGGSLLLWTSNTQFEVCTISQIGVGTVTISPTTSAHTRPDVVPLRVGTFAQALAGNRPTAHYDEAQALFLVTATEDLIDASAVLYAEYANYPLITAQREDIRAIEDTIDREVEQLDSKIGPVANYAVRSYATAEMSISITAQTAQEYINLRTLLASLRGRWKAFWLPSWNHDLVLTKSIVAGDDFIEVDAVGFASTYGVGTHVAVITLTGGFLPLQVTSVTVASGKERLHFGDTFRSNIAASAVDRVCKLTLSRLDADRVELQYMPGLATKVVIPTQEVPIYP